MMISPQSYIEQQKDKSYEELIKERDRLIKDVRYFEKHIEKFMNNESGIHPSPDVKYQIYLDYLGELCKLLSDKFNEKYEQTPN